MRKKRSSGHHLADGRDPEVAERREEVEVLDRHLERAEEEAATQEVTEKKQRCRKSRFKRFFFFERDANIRIFENSIIRVIKHSSAQREAPAFELSNI